MNPLPLILTIFSIHIFAWLTPGPLSVLIIRNSLIYSRKSGLYTAIGIAIGNFIHITYAVIGLFLLTSISPLVFNIIKYLGVGYITYLGIKTFFIINKKQKTDTSKHKDLTPFQAARIGFITNILSPKASLFFASIFASVIASGAPLWVVIFLWIVMPLNSLLMAFILSVFFTQKRVRIVYSRYQYIINKLLGLTLLGLALMIAFS